MSMLYHVDSEDESPVLIDMTSYGFKNVLVASDTKQIRKVKLGKQCNTTEITVVLQIFKKDQTTY